ncbi:MAG: ribosome biogenesis GTPase Der [Candidatus Marinimicrobia bacterium]|jgi:GTP-binding protein|nr:ribosome biogenesis GTPase Der [Candidatus Neomarinimicrobiota bacterium]MBT3945573.1 ribosome biogenesis GTPase Der [Candidatus Neomarinimicrobiota bacterium]MBT4154211.1 ribosome biogenesis GTPase Der [Candidatus Neomarinimicrobiota bacterium]MBT4554141.1 ribosome biogenesis GTPase Der [Candidatus Neomarinimicrobiota bacterium]MBT4753072.1 ribosome biogenesis GTPase Der [Candidatus Neomarinimicrobiota bacterium]|tara:strand:+ start:12170 stop:13486 length:1317 start_codon:yes stop_codon:yes gene_type:complete
MPKPIIAIVGRPNVGKSTFFNRLLSQRQAIVDAQEGITRDRIYGEMDWCGHQLIFIDTGGYIPEDFDAFNAAVREQAQIAMGEADLVLFMVDGKQGLTASDQALAQFVRECGKPYILVVNKCDGFKTDNLIHQFHEFGLNSPMPISALNGRQTGDLLDEVLKKLGLKDPPPETDEEDGLRLAIVGMPNVGKSSLTNALLQKDRTIVTPIAGTTRDAIDAHIKWHGKDTTLVDTAGLRKLAKIKDKIEYYSTVRTQRAINEANVVLVLIDAEKGFGKQDKSIVDYVMDKGKGLIFVVNKWDLIEKETHTMKDFQEEIRYQFKALDHYPLLFISALTKQRIHKVLEMGWEVFERSQKLTSTNKLNDALEKIISRNPPPAEQGKVVRIKYATQVSRNPSVIALYANHPKLVKTSYQRYIENQLRQYFDFTGIPVKLSFRKK